MSETNISVSKLGILCSRNKGQEKDALSPKDLTWTDTDVYLAAFLIYITYIYLYRNMLTDIYQHIQTIKYINIYISMYLYQYSNRGIVYL